MIRADCKFGTNSNRSRGDGRRTDLVWASYPLMLPGLLMSVEIWILFAGSRIVSATIPSALYIAYLILFLIAISRRPRARASETSDQHIVVGAMNWCILGASIFNLVAPAMAFGVMTIAELEKNSRLHQTARFAYWGSVLVVLARIVLLDQPVLGITFSAMLISESALRIAALYVLMLGAVYGLWYWIRFMSAQIAHRVTMAGEHSSSAIRLE